MAEGSDDRCPITMEHCQDSCGIACLRLGPPTRHPVTGRFLAFDCEVDCLEHCAGLCGNF